jgi:hypothetical protein
MKLIGFVLGFCSMLIVLTQTVSLISGNEQWTSADFLIVSIAFSFLSTACFAANNVINK